MKSPISSTNRKQTASFRIAGLMLTIAPLGLMLAMANRSALAQTSADVSSATASAAPSPADWTQFHRDNRQRWNPYETVLGVGNVGNLKSKWTNPIIPDQLTSEFSDARATSPVVANGVVYVGVSNNEPTGLYALNASTGAKLWSCGTGTFFSFSAALAVANGVVYADSSAITTSHPVQSEGNVFALNASTGALLWNYAVEGGGIPIDSPAVANGVVYFGSQAISGPGQLYALNASTGAKLWSYATGGELASSPAVANGVVYIGPVNGNLYALNAGTGAKLWSFAAVG